MILNDDAAFLKKMHELLDTAEDLTNYEALFNIFFVYKYMLQLGDQKLIEALISKEFYSDTFGALEYDPELMNASKAGE